MSALLAAQRPALALAGERWDMRLEGAPSLAPSAQVSPELQAWREAVDSDDAGLFAKRLRWAGIDTARASAMLAQSQPADEAPWLDLLSSLASASAEDTVGRTAHDWFADAVTRLPSGSENLAFVHALLPSAEFAVQCVRNEVPVFASLLSHTGVEQLLTSVLRRMSALCARPLTEQFVVDRAAGTTLLLSLGHAAAPGRERYIDFCHEQCADGFVGLLDEFPVLGRLLAMTVQTWVDVTVELLTRIEKDADALAAEFGCALPLHVLGIESGVGDTHRGGRSVALIRFAGADASVTVALKPKDMRIEAAFAELDAWFVDGENASPRVRVLERPGYGYASFVEFEPCKPEQLAAFYRGTGRLLALLHFLGTTDGHAENLIASGTRLVLIDPETLFEGRVAPPSSEDSSPGGVDDLSVSVLRTGLLPSWIREGPHAPAIDISALGADTQAPGDHRIPGWVNVNTDAIAWGWVDAPPPITGTSLPVPTGAENPLGDYVDELVEGFIDGYRRALSSAGRTRLLESIEGFRGARRRIVMRGTRVYGILQHRAQSPRCLRSANARGIELDRLARSSLLADEPGVTWQVLACELADLESLDIPYFDYPLGSLDIHGTGRVIENALVDDGIEQSLARVRDANESDLNWQAQLIRASIGVQGVRMGMSDATEVAVTSGDAVDPIAKHDHDAVVREIFELIEASSITDARGGRTWLSIAPIGDGTRVQLGMLDTGFYSGRAGLLAFFDAVARTSSDPQIRDRAASLIAELWSPIWQLFDDDDPYGGYRVLRDAGIGLNGAGGLLGLLSRGLTGIDDEHLAIARSRIIDAMLGGLIERDEIGDVIGGSAGAIGPLLGLREVSDDPRIESALCQLAERTLRGQLDDGGWSSPQVTRPLTGLSHGASGRGLALIRAGMALDRSDYVDAGARAFAYEHQALDAKVGNWPDYRVGSAAHPFMLAWCHGAPGIALARLRALQTAPDHADAGIWRDDLAIATTSTAAPIGTGLDHLCCGNLGRAHVLQQIGMGTGDPAPIDRAQEITDEVLDHWAATGHFRLNDFGTGNSAAFASCMTGLAGIGLHLLAPDGSLLSALG